MCAAGVVGLSLLSTGCRHHDDHNVVCLGRPLSGRGLEEHHLSEGQAVALGDMKGRPQAEDAPGQPQHPGRGGLPQP